MKLKKGFPPIAEKTATVLILGSMPGEESLRKNEYYGHPRNAFWKIMAILFEFDSSIKYEERTNILLKNKIALWDVMRFCERKGSLDSNIKDRTIIENDFVSFFKNHPDIKDVYFNGAKAEKEYFKRVIPKLSGLKRYINYNRLPSTSPAMTKMSLKAKVLEWSKVKKEKLAIS
ncbi:MAG: DNA-deoxyinosine glycosylase [Desulfobacteraceae bacterium]|jgi:hypoxanthine-DNA glycosylase